MRSRYTAYALHVEDHLFRTWHPRTRPASVEQDLSLRWLGLEVVASDGGGPDDAEGTVRFRAQWIAGEGADRQRGVLDEHSRFVRRGGRWVYVDEVTAD